MWVFKDKKGIIAIIKKEKKAIGFAKSLKGRGIKSKVANINKKDWMDIDVVWDL